MRSFLFTSKDYKQMQQTMQKDKKPVVFDYKDQLQRNNLTIILQQWQLLEFIIATMVLLLGLYANWLFVGY